jgi:outer membrane lipoprotein-sorting protein
MMNHTASKRYGFYLKALFILAAMACLGWADAWQDLKDSAATVTAVQADFVQEKHMQILARPLVSMGALLFKAPDSLRWEYVAPIKSILVMHDSRIRRFVHKDGRLVEDASAGLQSMQVVIQQITQWLNGRFDENPAFSATLEPGPKIVMTPREKALAQLIQRIEIVLAEQPGVLESVTIFESEDSFTRLIFQNVTLNPRLDDTAFSIIQ